MPLAAVLFAVIFIEGYVVLSAELLAIRQTIPFVGGGTDTVAIVIAAVLMPLAFGYYAGGRYRTARDRDGRRITPRRRLLLNIMVASVLLTLGLSHTVIHLFFEVATGIFGLHDRRATASLYAACFLLLPVFLLGQTIPLASHFFPRGRLPAMAGKILFFSTMGSFAGAVLCTLFLMSTIGVHHTASVTIALLFVLSLLLSRRLVSRETAACAACLIAALWLNSDAMMRRQGIIADNVYNTVRLQELSDKERILYLNGIMSSMVDETGRDNFPYAKFIEKQCIEPIREAGPVKSILVVGAGGFNLGTGDLKNSYLFVDIDPDLREIAETHLLKKPLDANKRFAAVPARAFFYENREQYDLIVLDVFSGLAHVPEQLLTREFFAQVRGALKPGGVAAFNFIVSPNFSSVFSIRLDNTLRSVFPAISRQSVHEFNVWNDDPDQRSNVVYLYVNRPGADGAVYTDNLNPSYADWQKPAR